MLVTSNQPYKVHHALLIPETHLYIFLLIPRFCELTHEWSTSNSGLSLLNIFSTCNTIEMHQESFYMLHNIITAVISIDIVLVLFPCVHDMKCIMCYKVLMCYINDSPEPLSVLPNGCGQLLGKLQDGPCIMNPCQYRNVYLPVDLSYLKCTWLPHHHRIVI